MNFVIFTSVVIVFVVRIVPAYPRPGDYIPKSFYKIDKNGHEYNRVEFQDMFPQFRAKRDASSEIGTNNIPFFFGPENFLPENFFNEFSKLFQQNVINPVAGIAAQAKNIPDGNYDNLNTKARSGTLNGVDGVQISSRASGPNGAFSYSASSIDSDGNAHYSAKTHQF